MIIYKHLTAVLFAIAFFTQTFHSSFIIASYFTNNASYAKLCENKAQPQMHCNGKCQMLKKLKQEENKNQQNPNRRTDNDEVLYFSSSFPSINITVLPFKFSYLPSGASIPICRTSDIFHPPQAGFIPYNNI